MDGVNISHYKVLEKLGEGGMGIVYKAEDTRLKRPAALKFLPRELNRDPEAKQRFILEAQAASALDHQNICTIYEINETEEGQLFIAMAFYEGETLKSRIDRGLLPLSEALDIIVQVAKGLHAAHEKGIVHRDIKPANIIITNDGVAKIVDFGLAKFAGQSMITRTGSTAGTVAYMSPEQARGEPVDHRTDIWSLGVTLYEVLSGCPPFKSDYEQAIIYSILNSDPDPITKYRPETTRTLEDVVCTALQKDPSRRFQTAREFILHLTASSGSSAYSGELNSSVEVGEAGALDVDHLAVSYLGLEDDVVEVAAPVFVARDRQLDKLEGYLQKAIAGHGLVVLITGEAGTGKTSLVNEFAHRAQELRPDLVVATGNCDSHTGLGDPYLPFRQILDLLTGDIQTRWAARAITREHALRLLKFLPVSIRALAESGQGLIDTVIAGDAVAARALAFARGRMDWVAPLTKVVERKSRGETASHLHQTDVFEQYAKFLLVLSKVKPLMLVIEDLQWADAGSIELLFHIAPRLEGAKALILCTYRQSEVALGRDGERHPLESVVNELKRRFGEIEIELGQAEDREFIDALLDSEPNALGKTFRDTLFRQTKGHPLFTTELLRGMRARGLIVQDDCGKWREGEEIDWDALPERIEAVLDERIGRLPIELQKVLNVACIEGEEFTAEVIARVLRIDELELVRLLSSELDRRHRLVKVQGIRTVEGQRISQYKFRHILFQKYLYNKLDEIERVHEHDKVGSVLEALYGEQAGQVAVQLARHFELSGKTDKTIDYLEKAGTHALRSYANREAIELLEKAIELDRCSGSSNTPERKARWEQQLGAAYLGIGRQEKSLFHTKQSVAILDRPIPQSMLSLGIGLLTQIIVQALHRLLPFMVGARSGKRRGTILEAARSYQFIAELCYLGREKAVAIYACLRAPNLAERAGRSPELARSYADLCVAAGAVRLHGLARFYAHKAQEIALVTESTLTRAYVLMRTGLYYSGVGEWTVARESINEAAGIFETAGDWRRWEQTATLQARNAFYQGNYEQSLSNYATIHKAAIARGDLQNQCLGAFGQASNMLQLGRIDEAVNFLTSIDYQSLPDAYRFEKFCAFGALSFARLIRSEHEQAKLMAVQALELDARADPRYASLPAKSFVARVLLTLAECNVSTEEDTRKSLDPLALQACRSLRKFAKVFPIGRPSARLWSGLYYWSSGKKKRAMKEWQKSLAEAKLRCLPHEEALCDYMIGRYSVGSERLEYLGRARDLLSFIGAEYDLSCVQSELNVTS